MKVLSPLLPTLFLLGSFAAGQTQTIMEIIASDPTISTLAAAFEVVKFTPIEDVDYTLFAPTDGAFAAVDQDLLSKYLEPAWIVHLQYVLGNHLLFDTLAYASSAVDGAQVNSFLSLRLDGYDPWTLTVNTTGIFVSGLAFNMSQVIEADIPAIRGVVHIVDKVFVPAILFSSVYDQLVGFGEYTILLSLLDSSGLSSVIQTETITLFAPPDSLLAGLPSGALDAYNITEILLNHVIIGDPVHFESDDGFSITTALGNTYNVTTDSLGTFFIGDVPVVSNDYAASNGLFHVIGGVLLPPGTPSSNITERPGMVSTDPPMTNDTEPPVTNETEPPMATDAPVASPVAGSAASSNSIVGAVLMLLASFSMMLL